MLSLLITGASGRMGQTLIEATQENPETTLGATHDQGLDLKTEMSKAQAVIDFTVHNFTDEVVETAVELKKPLVIGTTGHTEEQREKIRKAAEQIPIVFAPNFSIGVNTLFWLTRKAAEVLGNERCDIEVTEMHHKHKIDAPSGTARRLLEILNEATDTDYDKDIEHGRFGNVGPREKGKIGMHTLRGGDVVGDHTVMFAADGERVELTHKASSRMTFAAGAVTAAVWLQNKENGLFDMQDVLGLV